MKGMKAANEFQTVSSRSGVNRHQRGKKTEDWSNAKNEEQKPYPPNTSINQSKINVGNFYAKENPSLNLTRNASQHGVGGNNKHINAARNN